MPPFVDEELGNEGLPVGPASLVAQSMCEIFFFVAAPSNRSVAIIIAISMLPFVRNRATDFLPVIFGIFLKIGGASSRVISVFSKVGICVTEKIVAYAPVRKKWPVKTSVTFPFGVFDVNEGSRKGVFEMLQQVQEKSSLKPEQFSAKARIDEGDWLTVNNLRLSQRERARDKDSFQQSDEPPSLSSAKEPLNRTFDMTHQTTLLFGIH